MNDPLKNDLKHYEENRAQYTPYGFTCELWTPTIMNKYDRHNEVEINYLPSGSLTYLIHDRKVTVESGKIALFWGLYPHRIIEFNDVSNYYVVTIPLSVFLKWNLSSRFINKLMKGNIIMDNNTFSFDQEIFKLWHDNLLQKKDFEDIVRNEIHCRVRRLEKSEWHSCTLPVSKYEESQYDYVERMALYISSNFDKRITVVDVAKSEGLHPDYANSIFKKAFCHTLSEHIAMERIAKAQSRLLFSSDPITTIAYEVGYESLSCFNRAFKNLTGVTPRRYRENILESC